MAKKKTTRKADAGKSEAAGKPATRTPRPAKAAAPRKKTAPAAPANPAASATAPPVGRASEPGARTGAGHDITDHDVYLFNEGTHFRLYDKLGAHFAERDGRSGVQFAVWAPNARYCSVVGDFNGWDTAAHPMEAVGGSGIWRVFVEGLGEGTVYKFHIASQHHGYTVNKTDPFGYFHEVPPNTASIVRRLDYEWNDDEWMRTRGERNRHDSPMSIYELHAGSWMRDEHGNHLSYRDLAHKLAPYLQEQGFTHVELLPIMEHPLYRSWGYQTTGYFAPTSRYGTPQDFMYFVDHLHRHGIGVIIDWVPSHFPSDEHGLGYFDGTHLFEHADPRQGFHPDWKSLIFNYGRNEVRAFLISSAVFWLDRYHIDGIRVDAVASMLYLDYSRREGEWIPNKWGGRENVEAIEFLRQFNTEVYRSFPDVQTMAEESTAWPMVSRPVEMGGLGFGFKWDMGWMHDTLQFLSRDPVHRRYHHNELTFRAMYQFSENYVLPLSHDEVVHGKGSLLNKMAGDDWQKFANLRLLLANQWSQPGKKLLFMGGEIGQRAEWNHDAQVDWSLEHSSWHAGIQRLMARLNLLYREHPALHELDCDPAGFRWIEANDIERGVVAFLRVPRNEQEAVLCAFNITPQPRHNYRLGVPTPGVWREIMNTDAREYAGSGLGNMGQASTNPVSAHGFHHALNVTLPPLAAVFFKHDPSVSPE